MTHQINRSTISSSTTPPGSSGGKIIVPQQLNPARQTTFYCLLNITGGINSAFPNKDGQWELCVDALNAIAGINDEEQDDQQAKELCQEMMATLRRKLLGKIGEDMEGADSRSAIIALEIIDKFWPPDQP
ncbi:MAG: hypothetical protein AAB774_01775 [Patescibacteria group bacterium]